MYFMNESDKTPSGVFNFNQLTATIASIKSKLFVIEFHSCIHRFVYKASTQQERQNWLTVLSYNIMNSRGNDNIITVIAKKENF